MVVHVHLGLIGVFLVAERACTRAGRRGRLRLENDTAYADLRGATQCELITADKMATIIAKLGPDPLRDDADPDKAFTRIHRSRKPIGALLMDQSVLAGRRQRLSRRVAVQSSAQPDDCRASRSPSGSGTRSGTTSST